MLERVNRSAKRTGLAGWPDLPETETILSSGIALSSDALANRVWRNPRVSWLVEGDSGRWSALVLMRVPGQTAQNGGEAHALAWIHDVFGETRVERLHLWDDRERAASAEREWFFGGGDVLDTCLNPGVDVDATAGLASTIAMVSPNAPCLLDVGPPESDNTQTLAYDPHLGVAPLVEARSPTMREGSRTSLSCASPGGPPACLEACWPALGSLVARGRPSSSGPIM
ncbi:MAG TPA: hypothetical protein VMK66_08510 [Myxococcales bacterium]|nr:hypothetical protein [Myxococcales bacterium]